MVQKSGVAVVFQAILLLHTVFPTFSANEYMMLRIPKSVNQGYNNSPFLQQRGLVVNNDDKDAILNLLPGAIDVSLSDDQLLQPRTFPRLPAASDGIVKPQGKKELPALYMMISNFKRAPDENISCHFKLCHDMKRRSAI